mmetsp:Transcript_9451/g.21418  ORF Transcript_9451/g.21418 Transcript_9451/m.21418 type:complete len:92 (-) Transcript_9451:35-310(-)
MEPGPVTDVPTVRFDFVVELRLFPTPISPLNIPEQRESDMDMSSGPALARLPRALKGFMFTRRDLLRPCLEPTDRALEYWLLSSERTETSS